MNARENAATAAEPARIWRIIDRAFKCTGCGALTGHLGGWGTADERQELCNPCNDARIDADWRARLAGQ